MTSIFRKKTTSAHNILANVLGLLLCFENLYAAKIDVSRQQQIISIADQLLERFEVSYAYGGNSLGSIDECNRCNDCLEKEQSQPRKQLKSCPSCKKCSIDCSHFTWLVYRLAGMPHPYLTTKQMLNLSPKSLAKYRFQDLSRDIKSSQPGDLFVYRGHVVLLEKKHAKERGDVIHATSGKDIKKSGQGIQRERFVPLVNFRGPLLRILRPIYLNK